MDAEESRELDRRVLAALGWTKLEWSRRGSPSEHPCWNGMTPPDPDTGYTFHDRAVGGFALRIERAWELVEWLAAKRFTVSVAGSLDAWDCEVWTTKGDQTVAEELGYSTSAEAITRAFLAAVEGGGAP